jgi:predicted membrane metal-binding protein
MDAQTVQDFNRSGLVHFLAISGTHIVVIFGLFYFLLIKILPLKFRKYAIISSLIFIWFLPFLSDSEVPLYVQVYCWVFILFTFCFKGNRSAAFTFSVCFYYFNIWYSTAFWCRFQLSFAFWEFTGWISRF